MFYRMGIYVFALTLMFLTSAPQDSDLATATDDSKTTSNVFGNRSEYVTVHYDSGKKPLQLYSAQVKSYHGGHYLIGQSAPTNHFKSYAISLDRIQLMTFPNPDYRKKQKVAAEPKIEKSLAAMVKELRYEFQQAARKLNDINKVISRKQKQINSARRRSNDAEDEEVAERLQAQLKLLQEELEIHTQERDRMQKVVNDAELDYAKKRHQAVVQGVYSKSMDGL